MAGLPICFSLAFALVLVSGPAYGQSSPIETANPTLRASLERIAKGSALWREALDELRATGRRAMIVTTDQVLIAHAPRARAMERADDTFLAEVAPIVRDGSRVDVVLVVVNLALLQERHREQDLLPIEFDLDLDRILVHEVYGHAIPYLLAGHVSGRCADPQPRERAVEACSIRRENAVRAELRLGRRVDYGLDGLNLSRRD